MRNVSFLSTFRTFKAHFSPRKPTSYNDYDHGVIQQSLCLGYPVGSNNGRLVCSLSNSKNNLEQINAKQICTKLVLTVTYFITNQSLLPVKEHNSTTAQKSRTIKDLLKISQVFDPNFSLKEIATNNPFNRLRMSNGFFFFD